MYDLTVLADGSVLATGGESRSENAQVDLANPVFAAERWDPAPRRGPSCPAPAASGSTTPAPPCCRTAGYSPAAEESAASASRGIPGEEHRVLQPPYLYKQDGSGERATRPAIDAARPRRLWSDIPDHFCASRNDRQGWTRTPRGANPQSGPGPTLCSAVLHGRGSMITATAPATSNIAPAGYYMLFITDNAGVPSVAKMIKLQPKPAIKGASADFNGDGFSDATASDPYADPGGVVDAGQVSVLYGNSSAIGGGSVDTLLQGAGSVGDDASTGDRFGFSLAAADIDNDGYTDLLVGTPDEDVGSQTDSGMAQIIWGSSGGLGKGKASSNLTQTSFGRSVTAGDQLGYAVDAANELGADSPMVAVGVPGGNVSGQNDAGWAGFLTAGLSDPRAVDENSPVFRGRLRPRTGSAKPSLSACSPARPAGWMRSSESRPRIMAPEPVRSAVPAPSSSSTICTPASSPERYSIKTPQVFRTAPKVVIRSARLLTAYGPAAQLTWRSEFPSRTSEPQAMPAWSSSSPPMASALHRAPD